MTRDELESEYRRVADTEDFAEHQAFIRDLLASNDPAVIDYHFGLLRDRRNQKLYQRLRAGFEKRGDAGAEYLVKRSSEEKDSRLLGDILHMLGKMRRPEAVPMARHLAKSPDPDLRDKAAYVLGWTGNQSDAEILGNLLLRDPDAKVRRDAATAHDQMRMRLPAATDRLLDNLRRALKQETDEDVLAWIIVTLQYFLHKSFGLKEHIEERKLTGNVMQARENAMAALMKRSN